ncbi:MAG: CRTAC1 family protein, partial [Phycisphaerae bacterium]
GDGTFTDIADTAGVTNDRYAKGVAAGDYDNDGDMDLYVSNHGENRLYRNNGDGTFTDVAAELKVTEPRQRSFASWFFDYDNDGRLDLFVGGYQATVADLAADYLGKPHRGVSPCLYHNKGGRFENVAKPMGLDHPYLPMGANFGDLDNDGYLDIYLATGDPGYQTLTPNVMLRNDGGRRFQDVTTAGGFGHLQKGHGVAFADLDNDGDQDIYHQLGGFYPGDRFHNALFLNPGNDNRFLFIELIGTVTNRRAVGVRVKVVVETPDGVTAIHRAVGAVSSFGGSPARQEIGLGRATAIRQVEIWWPVSATRQVFTKVPLDAMIRVTEGRSKFQRVELRRVKLNTDN